MVSLADKNRIGLEVTQGNINHYINYIFSLLVKQVLGRIHPKALRRQESESSQCQTGNLANLTITAQEPASGSGSGSELCQGSQYVYDPV